MLSRRVRPFLLAVVLLSGVAVGLSAAPAAAVARAITFPVVGPVSWVDSFGAPRSGHAHEGQDLMAAKMQPIVSATDGTVTRATLAASGHSLVIRDAEGWTYHYIHMNNDTPGTDDARATELQVYAPGIRVGSRVLRGQVIGYVGDSGNAESTAPHLHFEIRQPDGVAVNPYDSLMAASRTTLDEPAHLAAAGAAGNIESITASAAGIRVRGWAVDRTDLGGATVVGYVDGSRPIVNGQRTGIAAPTVARPDVQQALGTPGTLLGFDLTLPVTTGIVHVCLFADDRQAGPAAGLGCAYVSAGVPVGNIDAVRRVPGGVQISGWALDGDTIAPIDVQSWSGGQLVGWTRADIHRPDIGAAFPASGPAHGFTSFVALGAGRQSFCAYGINDAPGGAPGVLGCPTVTLSSTPFGALDVATAAGSSAEVHGWALDPDTAGPTQVNVLVDGALAAYGFTGVARPDVAAHHPDYGGARGYAIPIALTPGSHQVCAYAIDSGPGTYNPLLRCATVTA